MHNDPTAGPEFASYWLKVGRAREHAETVCGEIKSWQETQPYSVSMNRDAKGSRHAFTATIIKPPDFAKWSLVCGDCIHNLRSALDHFAYGIGIAQSGKNPPPGAAHLKFPICESAAMFANWEKDIRSLNTAVRTAFERVQPYNRWHQTEPPPLAALRDLDNTDKHRLLSLAASTPQSIEMPDPKVPVGHVVTSIRPGIGGFVDKAEILSFTVSPPTLDVKYECKATISVCVFYPYRGTTYPIPVLHLLPTIGKEVARVVKSVKPSI